MEQYRFYQIDAFTSTPLAGNACAVVLDAGLLTDAQMLSIAREMNLSETAFVSDPGTGQPGVFPARYFTPAEEIPFAGHPTVATAMALLLSGALTLTDNRAALQLSLPAGLIPVDITRAPSGTAMVSMVQRAPEFLATHDAAMATGVFGLTPDDLLPGVPVQVVSTGTPQLMMALRDQAALRRAVVDVPAYSAFRQAAGFFSPHLFCLSGATPAGTTFARHFGVPPDTPEDPFTGSATGGMAAFLWHHGLVREPRIVAEQGHWMGRPGTGVAEILGTADAIGGVRLSGAAVAVLRGELML